MSDMRHWSIERFTDYLDRVADDYADSGSEATAEDYREAARRIREIPYLEQGAYDAAVLDLKGGRE